MRALFAQHDIELFSVKSAYKAAIVERFNRTLKCRLLRYFTMSLNQKWTYVLQDAVYAYNHSVHRTLGRSPASVTHANAAEIREKVFPHHQAATGKSRFKVGDPVRISKVKSVFEKGYLPNWTEEIFTVASINRKQSPITYQLKDYNNEVIEGSFYPQEIQKIIHDDDVFVIEKVIRTQKRGREKWSLVKWRGYPPSMNSWVRQSEIRKLSSRKAE